MKPRKTITRPKDDELRTMAAAKLSTDDIAARCGAGVHTVRKWMNEAGCQSDLKGWWNLPTTEPAQPAPEPTSKAALAEQFPFIQTRKIVTATGQVITMPHLSILATFDNTGIRSAA
ncbi:hypothetical protein [Rhizobium oryziradicis]|uniref:Uncharacterized protein n=1 Tax=Rhizobium oryziradicis TaxID=1867956 RepID=A0A1Q8ZQF1_9HYPH|nr:hypothetical protein [Rhizobium oryziradicis]OLP44131.1 hypothetical protein BJF95_06085 [Rhizobium oryziradicis]